MKLPNIAIKQNYLDNNVKFYLFLKQIVQSQVSKSDVKKILKEYSLFSATHDITSFKESIISIFSKQETKKSKDILDTLSEIFIVLQTQLDLEIFIFSLKLYLIKDDLLTHAKSKSDDKSTQHHLLSLAYDKSNILIPYTTRVYGTLSLLDLFNQLKRKKKHTNNSMNELANEYNNLTKNRIEINQIFMLLFNESLNQSIKKNSGLDYEERILSVLIDLGIKENNIKKVHDDTDKSTEFDFFFELNNKTYGIGAKRTLRERYKQFIKTAQMSPIDVMIEITLGTDLTEEKAKSIIQHGIYLFVADEIYQAHKYLQEMDKVFSCNDLTLETLSKL